MRVGSEPTLIKFAFNYIYNNNDRDRCHHIYPYTSLVKGGVDMRQSWNSNKIGKKSNSLDKAVRTNPIMRKLRVDGLPSNTRPGYVPIAQRPVGLWSV